ncbi:MAG: hypothetical protein GEU79_07895 [Acidimicrobiia bacterium]|nr:hypothetical protein [Acidimicrobiia bacterium]
MNDRGSMSVWGALLVPALIVLAFAFLEIAFRYDDVSQALNQADNAARACAAQIDEEALAVGEVKIDASAGPAAAAQFGSAVVMAGGIECRGTATVGGFTAEGTARAERSEP